MEWRGFAEWLREKGSSEVDLYFLFCEARTTVAALIQMDRTGGRSTLMYFICFHVAATTCCLHLLFLSIRFPKHFPSLSLWDQCIQTAAKDLLSSEMSLITGAPLILPLSHQLLFLVWQRSSHSAQGSQWILLIMTEFVVSVFSPKPILGTHCQ